MEKNIAGHFLWKLFSKKKTAGTVLQPEICDPLWRKESEQEWRKGGSGWGEVLKEVLKRVSVTLGSSNDKTSSFSFSIRLHLLSLAACGAKANIRKDKLLLTLALTSPRNEKGQCKGRFLLAAPSELRYFAISKHEVTQSARKVENRIFK